MGYFSRVSLSLAEQGIRVKKRPPQKWQYYDRCDYSEWNY